MSGERVSTHFEDPKDFADLLDAAEAADPRGQAADFVADVRKRYDEYGQSMFLSSKQKKWLENIAGETA